MLGAKKLAPHVANACEQVFREAKPVFSALLAAAGPKMPRKMTETCTTRAQPTLT